MTDFRQRQAASTLTAPAARGLAPHFLVQPGSRNAHRPATEILYSITYKKGYANVPKIEHHHNHFQATF